jgi:hypothetical protein
VHRALREVLIAIGQCAELAKKTTLNSESFREQAAQRSMLNCHSIHSRINGAQAKRLL